MKRIQYLLALLAALWGVTPTWAIDYYSPRLTALAGAGRAGPLLNDSTLINPSYISFLPTYAVGTNFTRITNGLNGRNYSVSVQDGRSELFQAGVAYSKREDASFVNLGASKAITKELSIGVSGKYWYGRRDNDGQSGVDAGVSASTLVTPWMQTAVVLDNLIRPRAALDTLNLRRELILASKVNVSNIALLYFDPQYTSGLPDPWGVSMGAELVLFQDFFLRGGFQSRVMLPWLAEYGRAWGTGLGWIAPKISLDYGFGRSVAPRRATTHVFGATIYF